MSFLLLLLRISYPYFLKPEKIEVEYLEFAEQEIDSSIAKHRKNKSFFSANNALFAFDPNTVTKEDLIKLGFWERTANTFLKYRSKGAVFNQKEDLKKVYGISEKFYNRLAPFIIIRNSKNKTGKEYVTNKFQKNKQLLELNTADSIALIDLKGVGPSYAKRILKYRSMLGGFSNIQQLKEIYGMQDDLYVLISQQCKVNPEMIQKLNINTADFKTVNKHPYINYELCKQFFFYRKNGNIKPHQLHEIIQDEETIAKLLPYLAF